jgi:hypothetical protein
MSGAFEDMPPLVDSAFLGTPYPHNFGSNIPPPLGSAFSPRPGLHDQFPGLHGGGGGHWGGTGWGEPVSAWGGSSG